MDDIPLQSAEMIQVYTMMAGAQRYQLPLGSFFSSARELPHAFPFAITRDAMGNTSASGRVIIPLLSNIILVRKAEDNPDLYSEPLYTSRTRTRAGWFIADFLFRNDFRLEPFVV